MRRVRGSRFEIGFRKGPAQMPALFILLRLSLLSYFALRSGFRVAKSTGTETCSWAMSQWPLIFL